jgi:hypothetical protein
MHDSVHDSVHSLAHTSENSGFRASVSNKRMKGRREGASERIYRKRRARSEGLPLHYTQQPAHLPSVARGYNAITAPRISRPDGNRVRVSATATAAFFPFAPFHKGEASRVPRV